MVVPQICSICEVPSPSAIMVAPVIALAREIDPFRMSKFVTHKVEVGFTSQTKGNEPDHFV
jgi:hypothetical protein